MMIETAYQALQTFLAPDQVDALPSPLNERCLCLSPEKLLPAVELLLENGVYHLTTITAYEDGDRLCVLYHFWDREGLSLRIYLNEGQALDTLTKLIPGAEFYEREIVELFGINIPDLDTSQRLFLPDDWQGPPPMRHNPDGQGGAHE